jgi:hypothetical protein
MVGKVGSGQNIQQAALLDGMPAGEAERRAATSGVFGLEMRQAG